VHDGDKALHVRPILSGIVQIALYVAVREPIVCAGQGRKIIWRLPRV